MDKKKDLGQIWTPEWVTKLILDEVGFTSDNASILDVMILEPSFGEGVFLKEIISRVVQAAQLAKFNIGETERTVNAVLHGVEYDPDIFYKTVSGLRSWCATTYGIEPDFSNLVLGDALDYSNYGEFHYVVGNPPYVRVHNLPEQMRQKVKTYSHSTGTTDLYIIFYEKGMKWLCESGTLGYIAPNSWTKNTSQKKFRRELIDNNSIKKIVDFGGVKIFEGASTYTNVTILTKEPNRNLEYISMKTSSDVLFKASVPYSFFQKDKSAAINIVSDEDYLKLSKYKKGDRNPGKTLGDVCKVQNGLATLGDKYFLVEKTSSLASVKDGDSDNAFLFPVVKASTYKGEKIDKKIIFPYKLQTEVFETEFGQEQKSRFVGICEKELLNKAPRIYRHLLSKKEDLESRSRDKNSLWFWYGRSQAIQETGKKKLVFSHVISSEQKKIRAFIVPANTLVYSGLFITEMVDELGKVVLSLDKVKKVVESPDFVKYCLLVGKDMSGGYKSVGVPAVKAFLLQN